MRPEFEKISDPVERSFTVKIVARDNRPLLSQAWHYHPELEICFTEKSYGKRFVGNQISDYQQEDLVMFGSNLPHGFTTDFPCVQVVIQMNADFLGKAFMDKPELRPIKALFDNSRRGLDFGPSTKKVAKEKIERMKTSEGFQQMIHLFDLLNLLAETRDVTPICTEEYSLNLDATNLNRVKMVYDYILQNFREEIKVKTVADLLNLTEVGFYKFIRRHTKKSFIEIVNEFRINHAAKLLISGDKSVAEVCFACGYNNVSYFNRKFKAIIGKTPSEFILNFQ